MRPDFPVVVSVTMVSNPPGVSVRVTVALSPWFRKKVSGLFGLPEVPTSNCSGLGGPSGLPLRVRNAKLMYSIPPRNRDWHDGLRVEPLIGVSDRLSRFIATLHMVG